MDKYYKALVSFKAVQKGVIYKVVSIDKEKDDIGLRDKNWYELVIDASELNEENFKKVKSYQSK